MIGSWGNRLGSYCWNAHGDGGWIDIGDFHCGYDGPKPTSSIRDR